MIADVSRGGQNIAWIAFDIADSNWPLDLSFPLFFQNLLAWAPRGSPAGDASIVAGRAFPLLSRPEVASASMTGPDGRSHSVVLDPLRPVYFSDTQRVGIYTVDYGEDVERFAVNLMDRCESSIRPSDSLTIRRGEFQAQRGQVRQNPNTFPLSLPIVTTWPLLPLVSYATTHDIGRIGHILHPNP